MPRVTTHSSFLVHNFIVHLSDFFLSFSFYTGTKPTAYNLNQTHQCDEWVSMDRIQATGLPWLSFHGLIQTMIESNNKVFLFSLSSYLRDFSRFIERFSFFIMPEEKYVCFYPNVFYAIRFFDVVCNWYKKLHGFYCFQTQQLKYWRHCVFKLLHEIKKEH